MHDGTGSRARLPVLRAGRAPQLRVRGRAEDPAWARPAFIGLLVLTAAAYLWNLTASGDANSFYAAAGQAGTKSLKALFFGSVTTGGQTVYDLTQPLS